jgi:hypothetical protein
VGDIRALGHSLANVDLPYLREVVRHARPDARWRISYHHDPADVRHQFAKFEDVAKATYTAIDAV